MVVSGLGKKTVPFSSIELGKLGRTSFNLIEIVSFLMAAIAILDEGLATAEEKCKGTALSAIQEHRPFLASMDKACRHLVRESLALMATFMMRQRSILGSNFAASVPNTYRNRIIRSPLSHFDVAPRGVLDEVRSQFEHFIQNRAFTSAVTRLGNLNKVGKIKRTIKSRTTIVSRGSARGQQFRGAGFIRGNRGAGRGALRGVKKTAYSNKNMRGYARRDRAIRDAEAPSRGRASTSGAGFSVENRQ